MKKLFAFLMVFILVLTGCGAKGKANLPMDGLDTDAVRTYVKNNYKVELGQDLKVDIIDINEFKDLRLQKNNYILLIVKKDCGFCRELLESLAKATQTAKINHIYFMPVDDMNKTERSQVAAALSQPSVPALIVAKGENVKDYIGSQSVKDLEVIFNEFKN